MMDINRFALQGQDQRGLSGADTGEQSLSPRSLRASARSHVSSRKRGRRQQPEDLERITTGVRLRPHIIPGQFNDTGGSCVRIEPCGRVTLLDPKSNQSRCFECDFAFDSSDPESVDYANQEALYLGIGSQIVDNATQGFNCCLIAYGQTGTGKTHTIAGDWSVPKNRGLLPRIAEGLFSNLDDLRIDDSERLVQVSYIEVYNDKLIDLLVPTRTPRKKQAKLDIHTHPTIGVYVENLLEVTVKGPADVERLAMSGDKARRTESTSMNDRSSRSHTIFSLKLEVRGDKHRMATVQIVDLAGRENETASACVGERMRELTFINRSLFYLANCVAALSGGAAEHVPFRNSKLTTLLSESLQNNSRTQLLGTLTPARGHYEDNLFTCRFLESCRRIATKPTLNLFSSEDLRGQLQREIDTMRKELGQVQEEVDDGLLKSRQLLLRKYSMLDRAHVTSVNRSAAKHRDMSDACDRAWKSLSEASSALQRLEEANAGAKACLEKAEGQLCVVEETVHDIMQETVVEKETDHHWLPPLLTARKEGLQGRGGPGPVPSVTFSLDLPRLVFA